MLSANQAAISQETDNCNTNINLAYLLPFYMFPITISTKLGLALDFVKYIIYIFVVDINCFYLN